jgi:outer membrane immunogenic protein
MKKFLLGILGAVVITAPALAADLPMKAPPPVLPPMFNWSGFYIGGNGGWAQSDNCWDIVTATALLVDGCHNRSGGIIGGQIGYRWQQPYNHFVFGVEAQGNWANLTGSHILVVDPALTLGTKTDGLGLFTGSVGFAWDTWLWYAKAGGAVTSNSAFINSTLTGIGFFSASTTRWGGVVGTGLEYAFAPNWSVGFEYDHLFMGGTDYAFAGTSPLLSTGAINHVNQDVDMVTVRFNYRFGGFGGHY